MHDVMLPISDPPFDGAIFGVPFVRMAVFSAEQLCRAWLNRQSELLFVLIVSTIPVDVSLDPQVTVKLLRLDPPSKTRRQVLPSR
jgi:hypothetical protein